MESLELRIARNHVERYAHDADAVLIRESAEAQDCMDCESFMKKGVAALAWLERCEETLSEAIAEDILPYEQFEEIESALKALYQVWLKPCPKTIRWGELQVHRGYDVPILSELRNCCARAEDWLDRNTHYVHSKAIRDERFAEEPW